MSDRALGPNFATKKIKTFLNLFIYTPFAVRNGPEPVLRYPSIKGPGCPSGYDAGLTNQTSLVRFPSPLKFS